MTERDENKNNNHWWLRHADQSKLILINHNWFPFCSCIFQTYWKHLNAIYFLTSRCHWEEFGEYFIFNKKFPSLTNNDVKKRERLKKVTYFHSSGSFALWNHNRVLKKRVPPYWSGNAKSERNPPPHPRSSNCLISAKTFVTSKLVSSAAAASSLSPIECDKAKYNHTNSRVHRTKPSLGSPLPLPPPPTTWLVCTCGSPAHLFDYTNKSIIPVYSRSPKVSLTEQESDCWCGTILFNNYGVWIANHFPLPFSLSLCVHIRIKTRHRRRRQFWIPPSKNQLCMQRRLGYSMLMIYWQ